MEQPDRLRRFGRSFREGANSFRSNISNYRTAKKVSRWVQLTHKIYHDYGIKHILLILVLIVYQFIGAGVFYYCEHSNEESKEIQWKSELNNNRSVIINTIIKRMFNNTEYLFFLTQNQSDDLHKELKVMFERYEDSLGVKFTDQKIKWDFWTAMLYAQMICTTIGGGFAHLYPSTVSGRVCTMIYAFFGIPLVLTILDDLGKILTKCLKTPWWLIKCGCRRMFRYCTKQTLEEIRILDIEDKKDLDLFDLPIPIAILVVFVWILICSATFCIWEKDWDYFVAFYFFFISLSTIGLGDISPSQPKYLLMLFVYIIIGLSLVSMCINLIQIKFEKTYQHGKDHLYITQDSQLGLKRRRSTLGVIRGTTSSHSLSKESVQRYLGQRTHLSKSSQTVLSFPSPRRNSYVTQSVYNSKICPRTLSIDDVMKLVDTEEGDILLLTELTRDQSTLSEISEAVRSDITESSQQVVVSKSFENTFNQPLEPPIIIANPRHSNKSKLTNCPSTTPILPENLDIEALEEMEDRLLLSRAASFDANPSVHFRSRLSLILEQQSVIDDEGSSPLDMSRSSSKSTSISSNAEEFSNKQKNHRNSIFTQRRSSNNKRLMGPSAKYRSRQ
ncbi:unnamed protein product [Bursaphelenchus xylophilus]|uniref:(pine wood nematode) hypothetical protein n=1 Tax=Bursaphelenchus xylophilus TaxID=6326 RepID=A0A1I7RNX4_BURXY|nr:unnamed protein product [Bursaphelenchus xylophilus]CAG9124362.1 unnamed protein product [Bursaphelenchus xylophilus]